MSFSFVFVLCLATVFCLIPLAFYLLWLVTLNRRQQPSIVSGRWDFTWLLLGLSGFILFGGGLLLSLIQSNVRFWIRGNFKALRDAWEQESLIWSLVAIAYLILVAGGSILTLLARRRSLVVYNVDPGLFEVTLAEVLDRLGRVVERRGHLWVSSTPLLELEPFPSGRTVTLRWLSDDQRLFEEVGRQLRESVPGLPGGESSAGRWLLTASLTCMGLIVSCLVVLVFGLALIR